MNALYPLRNEFRLDTAIPLDPEPAADRGVTVVSVVFMTGPVLFEHLDSVLTDPDVDELVVIDNGSTPEDAAELRALAAREPGVVLIQGQGNVGFAKACNLGAARATGEWLLFLNPDALLRPGVARAMIAAREARPETPVLVGGRISNIDGTEQRGGRRGEVTPVATVLTLSRLARLPRFDRFEIHREHDPEPDGPVEIATVSGACFLMSHADYAAVDGFDTQFFLHVEDVDLCWRVRQRGGVVLYHPKAEVLHYGHTSITEPMFVEYWKGKGLARYFRKRADRKRRKVLAWVLGPLIVTVSLARALILTAQTRLRRPAGVPAPLRPETAPRATRPTASAGLAAPRSIQPSR